MAVAFLLLGCYWMITALSELAELRSGRPVKPLPYQLRVPLAHHRGVLRDKDAYEWRRLIAWLALGAGFAFALGGGTVIWRALSN